MRRFNMYKKYRDAYGKILENWILKTSDNTCIPFQEGNRDYEQYLEWLKEGNEPEPADPT